MGLDMYLNSVPKIEGLTFDQIMLAERAIQFDGTINDSLDQNIREKITPYIRNKGTHFTYKSLASEVGYWRKSNQIHDWFVENVQGGEDECNPYGVTREQLEELLSLCKEVQEDGTSEFASKKLPTCTGFFFGDTSYGEYYWSGIALTISILEKAINKIREEDCYLYYKSSW